MRGDETTTDDGDGLDPREAAALLAQTKRDAKRPFNLSPSWITAFGGVVILVGYAALWLSTRDQHPYSGPSAGAIVLVYAGPDHAPTQPRSLVLDRSDWWR